MPDATKYPPSTHGVRARSISGSVVLWAESRVQGLENISLPFSFHAEMVEVEIGGVSIYRPFGGFRRAKSYCHLCCSLVLLEGKEEKLPQPETGWIFKCRPVVGGSLKHNTGGSTIFRSQFHPNLERLPPPLFQFQQPHERTCGSTAI
ncbi:hypothetical protein TNCV_2254511 [Trichonephila clavipes]|nr:hypothetical protein TNCV_2254511 [Trichonephila clavipes]